MDTSSHRFIQTSVGNSILGIMIYLHIFAVNAISNLSHVNDFPITAHLTVICSTTLNGLVISQNYSY